MSVIGCKIFSGNSTLATPLDAKSCTLCQEDGYYLNWYETTTSGVSSLICEENVPNGLIGIENDDGCTTIDSCEQTVCWDATNGSDLWGCRRCRPGYMPTKPHGYSLLSNTCTIGLVPNCRLYGVWQSTSR